MFRVNFFSLRHRRCLKMLRLPECFDFRQFFSFSFRHLEKILFISQSSEYLVYLHDAREELMLMNNR